MTVTLDFGAFGIIGDTYTTTTDVNGYYSFTSVPACENYDNNPASTAPDASDEWVVLRTGQFSAGGVDYGSTSYSGAGGLYPITMGTRVPNIYAPLEDDPQRVLKAAPVVINYNWDGRTLLVDEDLEIEFSTAMDSSLTSYAFDAPSTFAWDATYMTLTITPSAVLTTDTDYDLWIEGESQSGLTLIDTDTTLGFDRTIRTQPGIALISTNLPDVAEQVGTWEFTSFPVDGVITLTFDMTPNIAHTGTWFTLSTVVLASPKADAGGAVAQGIGATEIDLVVTAEGNTVTLTPEYDLAMNTDYELDFQVYSSIQGDSYSSGGVDISTEDLSVVPGAITGLATTTDEVDYNTTGLDLEWDIMPAATHFYIYAADNYLNPVRTQIGSFTAQQAGLKQDESVTLPSAFDCYTDAGQTPFSAGTEVYVWVRAKNSAGYGPFSDSITFSDNVAPADFIVGSNHYGSADNSAGTEDVMAEIYVGNSSNLIEYVANTAPTVTFTEGGGDAAFVPSTSTWGGWDNGLQYGDTSLMVTIPAGEVGAGDWVYVSISDNSGNVGTDSVRLAPYIEFTNPCDTSTAMFAAPNYPVAWTLMEPADASAGDIDDLDLYISYDGGTTWDTLMDGNDLHAWAADSDAGTKTLAWLEDTVRAADCVLGLADANGGFVFPSESFIYAGLKLMVATADSTDLVDTDLWWFDRTGTDSSAIPFSFSSVGFDEVAVVYSDDNWSTTGVDTFYVDVATPTAVTTTVVPDYYPYSDDANYTCYLGITYGDAPYDHLVWTFPVTYDLVDITAPAGGSVPQAHGLFNIVWNNITGLNDSLTSLIDIDYALVDGDPVDTTWTAIANDAHNYGYFAWSPIPAVYPSDSVMMRFTSMGGEVLAYSDLFTLQGYVMATPTEDDTLTTGDTFDIDFYQYGSFDADFVIQYSTNGGTTWVTIEEGVTNGGADPETYTWDPITSAGTTQGVIRIFEGDDDGDYDDTLAHAVSETFVVRGFDVTGPLAADTLFEGRPATMTWTTVGTFAQVYIKLIYNSDADTVDIVDQSNNTGTYGFTIPTPAATYDDARLVVYDYTDSVASDFTVDLVFMTPDLTVTAPDGAEVWQMSTQHDITWTSAGNRTGLVDIEYSTDSMVTWNYVVEDTEDDGTFTWDIPFIADGPFANSFIRVTEVWTGEGTAMTDRSDARFTIQQDAP